MVDNTSPLTLCFNNKGTAHYYVSVTVVVLEIGKNDQKIDQLVIKGYTSKIKSRCTLDSRQSNSIHQNILCSSYTADDVIAFPNSPLRGCKMLTLGGSTFSEGESGSGGIFFV